MFLANCNIQEFVTKQVKVFLQDEELSYPDIKALILSKAPIPQVQSSIIIAFNKAKESDIVDVKKKLEEQAYKLQQQEDKKQHEKDVLDEDKDNKQKDTLKSALKKIPAQLSEYESELRLLNNKLMRLIESQSQAIITNGNVRKTNLSGATNSSVERLRRSIAEYEEKIQLLFDKDGRYRKQLNELEARVKNRLERNDRRNKRDQARIGYKITGEDILDTLSQKNQALLTRNIKKQQTSLAQKSIYLIQEAEQVNYQIFLSELEHHLKDGPAHLKSNEIRALLSIVKLMRKHIDFEQEHINAISSLNRKKQLMGTLKGKQLELNNKLKLLKGSHPRLIGKNDELKIINEELKIQAEHNAAWRQTLTTPTLLLAGLTLLFVIPLILTVSGTIPFFISPALMYALVITPPSLLLAATLATGIAALVFLIKANSNDSAIKANQRIIESNASKMNRSSQSLKSIELSTLPDLDNQLKREENLKEQLLISSEKSKIQSEQAFKQASEIEPLSFSESPILNRKIPPERKAEESVTDELSELSEIEETEDEELSSASI